MAEKKEVRLEKKAQRIEKPRYEEPQYEEPQYEEPQYEEPQYEEPQYEEAQYEEDEYEASQPQDEYGIEDEESSNARGGRGGGGRRGRGGFRPMGGARFRHRSPINWVGGYYWNGLYWIDVNGICYTKNWLGQYVVADCNGMSSVEFGI